jgi:hypothetical protein
MWASSRPLVEHTIWLYHGLHDVYPCVTWIHCQLGAVSSYQHYGSHAERTLVHALLQHSLPSVANVAEFPASLLPTVDI